MSDFVIDANIFSQGCLIKANWFWFLIVPQDMWFYISEHEKFNEFGSESALVWHETNIPYAVYGPESTRTLSMKYYPSEVSLILCTKFDSRFLSSTIWRYIFLLSGTKAQWESLCSCFLCPLWLPSRPKWSGVSASCCVRKDTS